jgi:RNA polymerase sigma factor (sigma-70 family)
MAATIMCGFLDRLRSGIGSNDDVRSDAQLISAFTDRREAYAFTVLLHRYGPLVWAVCRRVTEDGHAAEDAFQATFLVLIRKAGSIRPRYSIGGWLHRTATNIALKARAMANRSSRRESLLATIPDTAIPEPPEPTDPAVLKALDEEIAQLPDSLRDAVVLCELQGLSRRAAAVHLRIAEGTVSSRLAAARKRLAKQLSKRGMGQVGGIAGLLASICSAQAGVPSKQMIAAARLISTEAQPVKSSVFLLVDGELRAMLLTKLTTVAMGAITLIALVVIQWPTADTVVANYEPIPRLISAREPTPPAELREGVIIVTSFRNASPFVLYTPDGKEISKPVVGEAADQLKAGQPPVCRMSLPRLSPDAKRLLAIKLGPITNNSGPFTPNHLWIFDLNSKDGPGEALMTDMRRPSVVWSTDGTRLYGSQVDPEKSMVPPEENKPFPMVSWVYDLKAKKKKPLELPLGHAIVDILPDGKTLLTVVEEVSDPSSTQTYLVPLDSLKPRLLTKKSFKGMHFSPDGKWVIGDRRGKKDDNPNYIPLLVVSVADGSERQLPVSERLVRLQNACWSSDGKRIAYLWNEEIPQPPGAAVPVGPGGGTAPRLTVADSDGRNAKTIIRWELGQNIGGLDWK